MAQDNQNEFPAPVGIENQLTRQTARHLPRFFRTDSNKKFLGGTLDPLTQPGKLTRINAYVGHRNIPNYSFDDTYVNETSYPRQYYQLEPSFVYDNSVTGKVEWYADYMDYMNSLKYFGAPVDNHAKLNKAESYSWDPQVDWDKLINYREYYWLPNGPDPITIFGENESIVSTYTITSRNDGDNIVYIFSPDGLLANPRLTLYRGLTYHFNINTPGMLFSIKSNPEIGDRYFYNDGVSAQLVQSGTVTFTVPYEAPSLLFYMNNGDINSISMIDIKDVDESKSLDVGNTILGKKTFTSNNGIEFINGMKIKFAGKIFPEEYAKGYWYVEGVGEKIKLISADDLSTPATYGASLDVPFDAQPFDSVPWEEANDYPVTRDYITIHRASRDRNGWTRNNRWFHINVIEASAKANGRTAEYGQNQRAIRPIIEFAANMKLFNYGWYAKKDVDLVDTVTKDVFSTIEGSTGYIVDGEQILPGYRILFTADTDPLVAGRTFVVKKIFNANENKTQITLQPVNDTEPNEGEVVYATKGNNKGYSFHYQNGFWSAAQKKTKPNQMPMFDLFDEYYNSYSDQTVYPYNNFTGNKIFSYKIGVGSNDNELGFPLTYKSINNIGDILFEFNLQTGSWTYQLDNSLTTLNSYAGFIRKFNDDGSFSYTNGWVRSYQELEQPVIRVLRVTTATNLIPIDVYDASGNIKALRIRVYVNNKKVDPKTISFETIQDVMYIKFENTLSVGDKVVYKVRSSATKNNRGYYEIPQNWQNNPLNELATGFTFGEVTDHVSSIIENILPFDGNFPGISNLANLGPISHYGQRFLQHAGSMPLSVFTLVDKHANIVKALRYTARKYTEFKKEFIRLATVNAYEGTTAEIVDQILAAYSAAKYVDLSSFYYSDMAAAGAASVRNYTVVDPRLPVFVIDSMFAPMTSSKRQILVYRNDEQLIYKRDYEFDTTDAFVKILVELKVNDRILIKDYANTDGNSYIPYTPSKLGLYPSWVPQTYVDDTFTTPTKVIQGHDGSITVAYNDYRDELILEFEKRIFNSRKVVYDPRIFSIDSVCGGYYRKTDFDKKTINDILLVDFLRWNVIADQDLTTNDYYEDENSFTYNYSSSLAPNGEQLSGYWRSIYKYFYDTDRPHLCPWEMQGFTIKPIWWDDVYGPAPYTSENKIMWDAIQRGVINDPNNPIIDLRYIRPNLKNYIPVDADGNLLSPLDSNLAQNFSLITAKGDYVFGDQNPVETAWRRSSEYPYSIMVAMCLLKGSDFIGKMWDRFTIKRNIAGQIYSTNSDLKIQPSNLTYPNIVTGNVNDPTIPVTVTSGLANFIEEYLFDMKYVNVDLYKETLTNLDSKMSYRIGGYTSKDQIDVLLDSRSPNASGTVFLPKENYKIFFNKSAPVDTVSYSGVIIEKIGASYPLWISGKKYTPNDRVTFQGVVYHCVKTHVSNSVSTLNPVERFQADSTYWIKEQSQRVGYKVRGYDSEKNYFEIFGYRSNQTDPIINVGGISEAYVDWTEEKYYTAGQIVRVNNTGFYRAKLGHTSSKTGFESDIQKWTPLKNLPIVGGVSAIRRTRFGTDPIKVNYGTIFPDIQGIVDFLLGYQTRLESWGFNFDDYNKELDVPLTWLTSAKEFMFWTLQNWAAGSVITLSPSASLIQFTPQITASIDNTDTDFYDYSIFKADGAPLKADLTDIYRENGGFTIKPKIETNDGIFHIRTNLVYKEHILLLDNTSIFNDVIYDKVPGYRQGRLKILGYKTMGWDGSYNSPGFLYDQAEINDWAPNTDFMIGDIVKYKNYYFTATTKIIGKTEFDYNDWKKLDSAPQPGLVSNFDYRIEQFRDFYSLDASNFDSNQESLARHLIGYQPRQYLSNIINDEVSQYKFYQGFIKEKGTYNSITKLFDVLRASGFSSIDIKEEWAFKVGDYGATEAYTELEFPLDEQKFRHNPQDINLTLNPQEFSDLSIYNIVSNDITVKPVNYNSKPFKTHDIDATQNNYGLFKYQVAGYVKDEDVDHIVVNEAALLNYDLTLLKERDKIWLGYTSNNDWTVYEYLNTGLLIKTWSITDNVISLHCNGTPDISTDDIVAISNLDAIDGLYKVQRVYNNIIEIFTFNSTIFTIQDNITSGILHVLKPSRFASLSEVSAKRYNTPKIRGEKIWIDSDTNGNWLVLENQDAFAESEIQPFYKIEDQQYGYETKISADGKWLFVTSIANESGKVSVYNRSTSTGSWNIVQTLILPENFLTVGGAEQFGTSIDVTENGNTVVVGIPYASDLKTTLVNGVNIGDTIAVGSNITHQGAVAVYTYNVNNTRYELDAVIASYYPFGNERFGTKVKISFDGTNYWLFVSSKYHNSDTGQVQIFRKTDNVWYANSQNYLDFSNILGGSLPPGVTLPSIGSMYGYDLDCTPGAGRVVVSAPFKDAGAVYVFTRSGYDFILAEVIDMVTMGSGLIPNTVNGDTYLREGDLFGYSLAITDRSLFVSCPNDDTKGYNVGSVYVFSGTNGTNIDSLYRLEQLILPPVSTTNERFGTKIAINPSNKLLAISAIGGANIIDTTFDNYSKRISTTGYELDSSSTKVTGTTFDKNSTNFYDRAAYTGLVYVYNRFDDKFIYGDVLQPINTLSADDNFGAAIAVTDHTISVGTPNKYFGNYKYGTIFIFDYSDLSWKIKQSQKSLVDISKFKKAFIYNTKSNTLIQNLDFYDPAKGRIPSVADAEIKYQTYYDPAVYQYGVPSEVTVDESAPWTDEHVGEVWWDLSKVKFTWYEQGDSTYRNNNWGRIFTGSTIDIYEWVESIYLPSRWAELADTEQGLAQGISGIPKDIDNFTWSSKFKYDPVSGTKTTLYYYWVKNKNIVPYDTNRKLSCNDISRLILDPKSQGYQFVSITSENTLSLNNIKSKLTDKDVSINLQFYEVDNTELLTHREYTLIAKDDPLAEIPKTLETKWFDSLIGYNSQGQTVPDTRLSKKQKYGTLNSPRQSWFINRFEALKQLFEYTNSVLAKYPLVDEINFSNLNLQDPLPSLNSGDIDVIVGTLYEIKFVGTTNIRPAKLSVTVIDGKLTNVFIDDTGYGYGRNKVYETDDQGNPLNWYGPNVKISGSGIGGKIQTVIDSKGQIIKVVIVKAGRQYDTNTLLIVRDYTVLVRNDETANNAWSLQTWDIDNRTWNRSKTQAYDVTRYWNYKDWYATGYGLSADISYLIDKTVDLNGLPAKVGDIVKVNNVGYGNWLLLERIAETNDPDFTNDYRVVGKQNGTIEFSNKLYNLNQDLGFDTNFSFDLNFYDQNPTTELRIILETIRDNILIDFLRIEYIKLFFNSIYYVLNEQTYTDWCFKTSFLKANHNVGSLRQRITFRSDELASYEEFLQEAKPYKSKIREWVSSYQSLEYANSVITDFDLPAYYNTAINEIQRTTELSDNVNLYPWKNWLDNHTYQITDIVLTKTGSNYTTAPIVIISGGGLDLSNPNSRMAKATAYIANGSVYKIVIDDPGYGYHATPTIFLSGGNGNIDETRAVAYAKIGKGLVRSNLIGIKFDRYAGSYLMNDFKFTDTFTGSGSKTSFKLSYAPEIEKSKFTILIDDIEIYGSQYEISIVEATHGTYTALEGYIVFSNPPAANSYIEITYYKNIRLYSASDRINYAYDPKTGQFGKDLAQLMTGVDYGGVTLTSVDFEIGGGWDVVAWDVSSWDNVLSSDDDSVFVYPVSNPFPRTCTLDYVPAVGEVINIYVNGTRVDNGTTVPAFIGDGVTDTFEIPMIVPLVSGDEIVLRKSTSDGSVLPTDRSLIDSLVSGGDFTYTSAAGINPEDIIVDGDGFVTTDTSFGPEELVQGQVVDALDIKVYHTPSSGGPTILVDNYTGNGVTDTFKISQLPGTLDAVFLTVDGLAVDYTIDFMDQTITLGDVPAAGSKIVIVTGNTAGYDILDKVTFIGDGTTTEFLTAARYSKNNVSVFVTVNGVDTGAVVKVSDSTYEAVGNVVVSINDAPVQDAVIQIIVFSGNIQKYSKINNQVIPLVSGQTTYTLDPAPAILGPLSACVFVTVDNDTYLKAPDYQNFVYDGSVITISDSRYPPLSLKQIDMNVYLNGIQIISNKDFTFDPAQNEVNLASGVAKKGDEITVEILKRSDYFVSGNQISLINNKVVNNQILTVTTFTNHDIVKIKRNNKGFTFNTGYDIVGYDSNRYELLTSSYNTSGIFDLPRSVTASSGVFVMINNKILSPNIDYVVLDNKRQLKVKLPDVLTGSDYIEIITTNENVSLPSFGFKIFKDMLNRTSYKALDNKKVTTLAQDLHYLDTEIVVTNGAKLTAAATGYDTSNKIPGVIEINGERIEYFIKNGNVLSQLRRGTLGTSMNQIIPAGTKVYDIGPKLTMPYADTEIKFTAYGDGTNQTFAVNFAPTVQTGTTGSSWYRETIPTGFGQCNELEVFVAGRRLVKNPIEKYDQGLGQDSYNGAGDKVVEAEFSVNGIDRSVRLTTPPNAGELVVIISKRGKIWQKSNENVPLVYSTSDIARFLNTKQVDLPK